MSILSNQAALAGLGNNGFEVVAAGASTVGPFVALQFVTAGDLSVYTGSNTTGTVTGITYPANFILYGPCTAFTAGGTVVAYKGNLT